MAARSRSHRARVARGALVTAIALGALLAPSSAVAAPDGGVGREPSSARERSSAAKVDPFSAVAHVIGPSIGVFEAPESPAPKLELTNPNATDGALVFLVEAVRTDGWVQVLLPVKPNGSTGWVRADEVEVTQNPYRVVVHVEKHRLDLFEEGKRSARFPIGVGKESTPTPGGTYFITQLFAPPDPDGPYGPFAYSLSGFSEVLTTFKGGDAIIGIHGTNRPDLVGQDVSAGCIRLKNEDVTKLSQVLPLGTPVDIRA